MNKDLIQDAIDSLGLTEDEVDSAFWMRGEVEVLEYYLTKALYRTEYGIEFEDGRVTEATLKDALKVTQYTNDSRPVYRTVNRHTSMCDDWTPVLP